MQSSLITKMKKKMEVTRKEEFIDYFEQTKRLCKTDGVAFTDCVIELRIKMPTGEIETIINPNILNKVEYVKRAYDDDLHLKTCSDIYIVEYCVK